MFDINPLITAVYKALACTIEVDAVINWTDPQIVWWWINGEVIQPERLSSFNRLIRVTALVLKFIRKVKRSMETQPDLNMQEIIAAEHVWYKKMQMKLDEKEKSSTV